MALVVPVLPDPAVEGAQMGFLAAKIVVMFFGFEVLVGELRGRLTWLLALTIVALGIVGLRELF